MNREQFNLWGTEKGLEENWTLSQLDSLFYAQFLADFSPILSLQNDRQLNEFIMSSTPDIWDDQNLLFNFLISTKLPYRNWKPQILTSLLPEEQFTKLKSYVHKVGTKTEYLHWCDTFMRFALYDSAYLQKMHMLLTAQMEKVLNKKLIPTYSYLSMYGEHGICPPHRDHSGCQWTLDLCVNQDKPWSLFVEDQTFLMEENDALVYSGTDQLHWREKIHPRGYCHLVFFHFKEA